MNSVWSPMRCVSWTLHSIQAMHDSISGASIFEALKVASFASSSLPTLSPETAPKYCVWLSKSRAGKLRANCSENLIMSWVCRPGCTATPIRGGARESGVW